MPKPETAAQFAGHTPGPWEFHNYRVMWVHRCAGGILASGLICDTANNKATRTTENAANARLIAAAPELLTELERAHGMIRHYLKCGYLPHMSAEEAEQLVRNPDSAIRKAKGETL